MTEQEKIADKAYIVKLIENGNALVQERDEARAEVARLQGLLERKISEVMVEELHVDGAGIDALFRTPFAAAIGAWAQDVLDSLDAPNYVTANLDVMGPDRTSRLYITVGKREGKTPSDKMGEIEARLAKAEGVLDWYANDGGARARAYFAEEVTP